MNKFEKASAARDLGAVEGEVTHTQFLTLFFAVFLPMFLSAADQTMLATATPTIVADLGGLTDSSWISVAYLLASAAVTPLYGRLGDARGRRTMLLYAIAIFSLGSLICGFAQSLPQLIAARVFQGLGGGGMMMLCHALIGELVSPRQRLKFQGYFALVFTMATVGGPVIGGVMVSYVSWRWLFFANLPLSLFAAWRLWALADGERHPGPSGASDILGIVLFAVGATAGLLWFTAVGHHFSWNSTHSAVLVLVSLVTLVSLIRHELQHHAPLLPIDLVRERAMAYTLITTALFAACMFAMVFLLPIYLQMGHGLSVARAGLLLLPLTAGLAIGALAAGRFVGRSGRPKRVQALGMSFASLALVLLGILPSHVFLVAGLGFAAGLGLGVIMPINQLIAQTVAGRSRLAVAIAMLSLFRSFGGAVGAALFGALAFALMPEDDLRLTGQIIAEAERPAVIHAFHVAFLVVAAVAAAGAYAASRAPQTRLWAADEAAPNGAKE